MEAFKKWKTIAIASILVAVISLGGLCYTVVPRRPLLHSGALRLRKDRNTGSTDNRADCSGRRAGSHRRTDSSC